MLREQRLTAWTARAILASLHIISSSLKGSHARGLRLDNCASLYADSTSQWNVQHENSTIRGGRALKAAHPDLADGARRQSTNQDPVLQNRAGTDQPTQTTLELGELVVECRYVQRRYIPANDKELNSCALCPCSTGRHHGAESW